MKVIDMHCDTITALYRTNKDLRENDFHVDLKKMKNSDYLLQNFAVFTNIARDNSDFTKASIDYFDKEMDKNRDLITPVRTYKEIIDNLNDNKMCAMLTLEEAGIIDNDINNLNYYYDRGVRMITLTWNYPNGIGFPNFKMEKGRDFLKQTNDKDGLTPFGIEVVKKMEELGIIIDVSHLSDKGFYDVLNNTEKPFVASHSNSRTICNVARNLTDDMILKLAERGGVMGMNFCGDFISDDANFCSIKNIIKHIKYIKELAGIDVIGLGSDFDGIGNELEFKNCGGLKMLEEEMRKEGFTEEEIEKVFYKNVLRVYKEVLK